MNPIIKLDADFNSCDEQGRVRLNTVGSFVDIEQYLLEEGMGVLLSMRNEFEIYGTLVFAQI